MTSRFGALLQRLRDGAGLTQEELAGAAGVSVRTVGRLEAGERRAVRPSTLREIARVLAQALERPHEEVLRELQQAHFEETAAPAPSLPSQPSQDPAGTAPSGRTPARCAPARWSGLAAAMDALAHEVRGGWRREEEQRRVRETFAIPLRWRARWQHADHHKNILLAQPGTAPGRPSLDGELGQIAELYRGIPSGRLVVLGRAGSGKTVVALRFLLGYLETREPDEPVPVIFSLGSWNPAKTHLDVWLAQQLLRDHPWLGATGPRGGTQAAELIHEGCVLPVLDGFDEIAPRLHADALRRLNEDPARPLLVTSRTEEFALVTEDLVLTAAAVVELDDLSTADVADYLPRTARPGASDEPTAHAATVWTPVLERLAAGSDADPAAARLAEVLRTPLMVTLARTLYSEGSGPGPVELLETGRFRDADALEEHLLAGYVPAVYRSGAPPPALPAQAGRRRAADREWGPDLARHYLGQLARHLAKEEHGDRHLAWWELSASVRPATRILTVVLACTAATVLSSWLVSLPVALATRERGGDLLDQLLAQTLLFGPAVGLAFGLVYGVMTVVRGTELEPATMQPRWPRRGGRGGGVPRRYRAWGLAGLAGGLTTGIGYGPAQTIEARLIGVRWYSGGEMLAYTLVNILISGLNFGLSAGLVFALVAALEEPMDTGTAATPAALLAANGRTVRREFLLLAPLLALVITLVGAALVALLNGAPGLGPLSWPLTAGALVGAAGGLAGAGCYVLAFTAWGQWLLFGRIVLPLTGRLPWRPVAFLEDAYRRGVLRQAGAVYQFRHAKLQEHLVGGLTRAAQPDTAGPLVE